MKHAFLIMAHEQPEILLAQLQLLDDARNDIFLHIDRKAKAVEAALANYSPKHATLYRVVPAQKVFWGDISQVKTELLCFKTARKQGSYAYYHLLSGVDMPLCTMDELHAFFEEHRGKEFVSFWKDDGHCRDLRKKVCRHYLFTRYLKKNHDILLHRITTPIRKSVLAIEKALRYERKHQTEFHKGFNWCSLTDDFCAHLLSEEQRLLRLFRRTLCPDEIYKQTCIWNSPFRSRLFDTENPERGCMRRVDWHRGSPYVWQAEDIDELLESGFLFARKFSLEATKALLARRK